MVVLSRNLTRSMRAQDAIEGIGAFLDKRRPPMERPVTARARLGCLGTPIGFSQF